MAIQPFVPSNYELWLLRDDGERLQRIEHIYFLSYQRMLNSPGWIDIGLPDSFPFARGRRDFLLDVFRKPPGGVLQRENTFFVRRKEVYDREDGVRVVRIGGFDPTELLRRRIVAYYEGSPQAKKTNLIANMMKAIVRENMGTLVTDSDREFPSGRFTVEPNALPAGDLLSHEFPWTNVLETLQELARISAEEGVEDLEVFFDVVTTGRAEFEFRTYTGVKGEDRTSGPGKVTFGLYHENLDEPHLIADGTEEVNYAYVGGEGTGEDRTIHERSRSQQIAVSLWNRREVFVDASSAEKADELREAAKSVLWEGRFKGIFGGDFLDTGAYRYGIDWDLGDKVLVNYHDVQFPTLVRAVFVVVNNDEQERIFAQSVVGDSYIEIY